MKAKHLFTYGTLYLLVRCITHCSNAKGSGQVNQAGRPGNLGGQGSVVARRRNGLGREVTNESEGFVYLWYSIFVGALHHSLF
jgi:hypothetical protein